MIRKIALFTGFVLAASCTAALADSQIIPKGFEPGCNPCRGQTAEGQVFELAYETSAHKTITTLILDGTRYEVETDSPIWDDSFPGFVRMGFDGLDRKDIYALQAPSGAYNTYQRYFLRTDNGWSDLGTTPTLRFDAQSASFVGYERGGTDAYASFYDLHDGVLKLVRTEKIHGE